MSYSEKEISDYLTNHLNQNVELRLNRNRSTFLSVRQDKAGTYRISLHRTFLNAEEQILKTLVSFIQSGRTSDRNGLRDFVQQHREPLPEKRTSKAYRSDGKVYDLEKISGWLNTQYFNDALEFRIGWSDKAQILGRRVRQMTLGKCYYQEKLILIHPILDQECIPAVFTEMVVYHELCHLVVRPVKSGGGRMLAHSPEFKALERQYSHYAETKIFEKKKLPSIIRKWHSQSKNTIDEKESTRSMFFLKGSSQLTLF